MTPSSEGSTWLTIIFYFLIVANCMYSCVRICIGTHVCTLIFSSTIVHALLSNTQEYGNAFHILLERVISELQRHLLLCLSHIHILKNSVCFKIWERIGNILGISEYLAYSITWLIKQSELFYVKSSLQQNGSTKPL